MKNIRKIIEKLVGVPALKKKINILIKKNKEKNELISSLVAENSLLRDTLEEFTIEFSKRNTKAPKEEESKVSFQDYTPIPEKDVYKEVIQNLENSKQYGISNCLQDGRMIAYSEINIDDVFLGIKANVNKELELKGDNTKVVLESHTDNSISAAFYGEDGKHLRSVSTAESSKNKNYSEEDLKNLISLYLQRGEA